MSEVTEEWSEVGFKTTTLNRNEEEQVYLQTVGKLEGQIQIRSFDFPIFHQSDLPRRQFPRHIYLCIHLNQITGLPPNLHHHFLLSGYSPSLSPSPSLPLPSLSPLSLPIYLPNYHLIINNYFINLIYLFLN